MSRRFTLFWALVLILALFATSGAGYYAPANYRAYLENGYFLTAADEDASNPLFMVGTIASVLLAPAALFALTKRISQSILLLLCVSTWVLVSASWSNVFVQTVVIVGKTVVYLLGASIAAKSLGYNQIVRCVSLVAILICAVSLYLCWSDPIFRISIGADGWRGLFAQKNRFASFTMFSIVLIYPAIFRRNTRVIAVISMPILLACLILSQGKTALALALVYMGATGSFVLLARRERGAGRVLIGVSLFVVAMLVIAALVVGVLIFLGGQTFTGRVDLWRWFLVDLGDRLIFGAGGVSAPTDPAFVDRALRANKLSTPDSSFIMLLYNQGVIGVILYILIVAALLVRCVRIGGDYAIFVIVTLATYVVFGFFESDLRFSLSFPTMALALQMLILERKGAPENARINRKGAKYPSVSTEPRQLHARSRFTD